jgi:hypothetical protein
MRCNTWDIWAKGVLTEVCYWKTKRTGNTDLKGFQEQIDGISKGRKYK